MDINKTTYAGNGITINREPYIYNNYKLLNKDLNAFVTFLYIPPNIHSFLRKNPAEYPFTLENPLKQGARAKPITYSTDLISLFLKNENSYERGRIYFGRERAFINVNKNILRRNDLALVDLISQYVEDFKKVSKGINPTLIDGRKGLEYTDPESNDLHGINDVSAEQFTFYLFDNDIKLGDGKTFKNERGILVNQPSKNGTTMVDVRFNSMDLAMGAEEVLGAIARPHYPQKNMPFDCTYATFGSEILTPDQISLEERMKHIKGNAFMALVTRVPLLIQETMLNPAGYEDLKKDPQYNNDLKNILKRRYNKDEGSLTSENLNNAKQELSQGQFIREKYGITEKIPMTELKERYGLKPHFVFKDAR